jgi:UDP:flavonoid glycosyltransferase YjiC (YdhE family)
MQVVRSAAAPVLMVWEHGANLGHLGRLLPIAAALRARGTPVVLAVANPAVVTRQMQQLGVMVVHAPRVAALPPASGAALCPAEVWLRCGFASPSDAQACILQWLALFGAVRPAAMLVDASPMALYAGSVAGIATVAIGHGFELPPQGKGVCFVPWLEDLAGRVAYSEDALALATDSLAKALQPQRSSALGGAVGDVLNTATQALCVWPELDHFDRPPSDVPYLGPIWHAPPGAPAMQWPDKAGAKVLCYLTLSDRSYEMLWQALQLHGANVVLVSPGASVLQCEQVRARGAQVCAEPVALNDALQECDAVIGHGGLGLTSMALQAGKPLMLLPSQLEQGLLAYQLVRRKQQMHERVAQLLQDAGLQAQVGLLASNYAQFDPAQTVEKIVNMLLTKKMPETMPC